MTDDQMKIILQLIGGRLKKCETLEDYKEATEEILNMKDGEDRKDFRDQNEKKR